MVVVVRVAEREDDGDQDERVIRTRLCRRCYLWLSCCEAAFGVLRCWHVTIISERDVAEARSLADIRCRANPATNTNREALTLRLVRLDTTSFHLHCTYWYDANLACYAPLHGTT